jgi:hypothetical protein
MIRYIDMIHVQYVDIYVDVIDLMTMMIRGTRVQFFAPGRALARASQGREDKNTKITTLGSRCYNCNTPTLT